MSAKLDRNELVLAHLPDWAQWRCATCGEIALPNSGLAWSSEEPDVHRHFTEAGCERNQARMATLPIEAVLMHQALVEARQTLGQWVCEADDEDFTDEAARVVFAVMDTLDRGLDADKLVGFQAEAPK